MDEDTCMVDVAKFFMDFIQRESCGKCIPCREGTRRMLEILDRITGGRSSENGTDALERFQGVMYLDRLAGVIRDTSLCGLGQTAPNPVLSTLRWFRDEYEAHIFERRCPAGACAELLTYTIDPDACKGCRHVCQEVPGGRHRGRAEERRTTSCKTSASAAEPASRSASSMPSPWHEHRGYKTVIEIEVNERTVPAKEGEMLLDVLRRAGRRRAHAVPHGRPVSLRAPAACASSRSKDRAGWCPAVPSR